MAKARYEVIGVMPIRDAETKESVPTGGIVTLDDADVPRAKGKPLAGTRIEWLIEAGLIRPVEEKKKAKES
jgi:hypothetical protein